MAEKESLNLISVLQNPPIHFTGDRELFSTTYNIDAKNVAKWIAFEDKLSIVNFSGLAGKGLYEVVLALTIINMQGGITSRYVDKLMKIPKDKITRIYYKYQPHRKKTYSNNAYKMVCYWMKNNNYISELEFNRLLSYPPESQEENAVLDDFNHDLFKNELINYAQEHWNDIK